MRLLVFFLSVFLLSATVYAQKTSLKDLEQKRKDALREIAATDKTLQETKKTTSTLLGRIKLISEQILARKKVLTILGQEIEAINTEQKNIEIEVAALELELKERQKSYAKAIDGMLTNRQGGNKLLFVLSGESMSENYRRFRYLKDYSEWRSKQADDIKDQREALDKKKKELAKAKSSKMALLAQRGVEQSNLEKEEGNFQSEMTEAQKKQKELQQILAEKKKQADALNRQISKIIAEEVARQERETKLAEAKKKVESGKTTPTTTAEGTAVATVEAVEESKSDNVVLSNNFASNKGKLPYPISGKTTVTTGFGRQHHIQWNITTASNGIDIQSQPGAQARAVFNGEVTRVVMLTGYNNGVIVRHGNYYTFYGNIQAVSVKQGDKVNTGQSLGQVFTDPDTNTSQLHFELWQGLNKLDPKPWLAE